MRFFLLTLLISLSAAVTAQERFTDWRVTIVPAADRSVTVTEQLSVVSTGDEIRRGITRSLPTDHPVEVLSVERDGEPSPYHTRSNGGLLTVYVGDRKLTLRPGSYTYRIRYTIGQAVDRTEGLDELQFEVVGPGVDFPVEKATAQLRLPDGLEVRQYACYTGAEGDRQRNCTIAAPDSGQLTFNSTGALGRGQQFSVAAGFSPGFFSAPAPMTVAAAPPPATWFQREGSLLLWLLLLVGGIYYAVTTWRRHGVDPPAPKVGTVHSPPRGLSPASVGHLSDTFGQRVGEQFTASIMALATGGYLRIEPDEEKGFLTTRHTYRLERVVPAPDPSGLPEEQALVHGWLFDGRDSYLLEGEFDKKLHKLYGEHRKVVSERHQALRAKGRNLRFVWPLVLLYLASLPFAIIWAKYADLALAVPIAGAYAVAGLFGLFLYGWLIRRPDEDLVAVRAEIDSLKQYLELPEEKRKRLLNAPKMSREHYEALLPYAIALGINQTWSGYFQDMVVREDYHPLWLVGGHSLSAGDFGKNFHTAVGGSSTPVNTSSASGGGGSVGGGVGGGGAGGW